MQFIFFSYAVYIFTVYVYFMSRTDFYLVYMVNFTGRKTPSTQCALIGPQLQVIWFLTRFVTSSAQRMLREKSALVLFSLKLVNII